MTDEEAQKCLIDTYSKQAKLSNKERKIYTHGLLDGIQFQKSGNWKPTEEQIEALESATANCAYSEYQDCLRELIGQLKKL